MQFLVDQLLNKRYFLAVLTLVLGAVVAWGVQYTSIDASFEGILDADDPYLQEVNEVELDFPPSTAVLFAFIPESGNVFDADTLQAMEDLTNRFGEVESAVSIGSVLNHRFDAVEADLYGRDYLIGDLTTLDGEDREAIRSIALADEDLTQNLLSPDGEMALAVIKYRASSDDQDTRLSIARSVVALRDSLRAQYPEIGIYILGRIQFELDSYNAQIEDRVYLSPLVVAATVLLLWFCLRSILFSFSVLAVSLVTIGLTVGSVGWSGVPFNQISNMAPLVVLMIAMADGIHIVSIYLQGLHKGMSKLDALRESLLVNFRPVTLATITTAMGFLSLNYCSSPGIYGFGNVVAVGVCWAFLVTFTLLPTLILLLPVREVPVPLGVRGFIDYLRRLVATRGNLLFYSSLLVILGTLALLPLNRVDFTRYSFVDEDSDFHKVIGILSEKIGNDESLVYSISSGEYYGITEPEFLGRVEGFVNWLETQPEASFVNSYTELLKTLNMAENDNDEQWRRLPTDQLQIIDYLVSYQLIQEIEPHLEPIFDAEYSAIRLMIGTSNLSNSDLIAFNDRIEGWVADNLEPDYRVMQGDNSILFARLDQSITTQLLQGFVVSFALITVTMLIGLRSIRYGLISIMPNLFPATIVFGVWGYFVGELSPYILMLFSISIGLVVDDSVHVLSKYSIARRDGQSPEGAVQYAMEKAGPAITITTASLAVGTTILVFSNTFYYQNVALLLTPIIVVALLLDMLFLPPLLVKFDNWLERRLPNAAASA
ncbi:MAG: MMPL family transporter [Pseudomonadota bacterium]